MSSHDAHTAVDYRDLLQQSRSDLVRQPKISEINAARDKAEKAAEEAPRREDRAEFCQVLAQHYTGFAEPERAQRWIEEAERLSAGVPELEASTAYIKAAILHQSFDFPKALSVIQPYVGDRATSAIKPSLRARIQTLYAGILDQLGDVAGAHRAFAHAIELREGLNDPLGLAVVYYNYGEFCAKRDDDVRALEYLERALRIEEEHGVHHGVAQSAMQMALIHAQRNSPEQALRYYELARSNAAESGVPTVIAFVKANAASLYQRLGDETAQLAALLDAKTYLERHSFDSMKELVLANLAEFYLRRGDLTVADPLLQRALNMARRDGNAFAIGQMTYTLGVLRKQQGRLPEAATALKEAVERLSEIKAHVLTLKAFGELATVQAALGAHSDACVSMVEWARTYVEEHNQDVEDRLRRVQQIREQERLESQDEIYRLRNVELSAAMDRLKVVNSELRDLAVEKDEFMAIAAHDLRNPLADMRSMLQTVIGHYDILSKDDVLDICRDLLATTTRMSATVHAFLEISRTDRRTNGLENETMDVVHIAHRAIDRFASRAAVKSVKLAVTGPHSVFAVGDASIVDAILDNLISNAIKFVPNNTTVTLEISCVDQECFIRVIDEGPGISAEDQPKLFTKYGKLTSRPTGGEDSLGLGLYLARRMAERMNARLEYEPRDRGACFVLRLPCAG